MTFFAALVPSAAQADCTAVNGKTYKPGQDIYNADFKVRQYCAGTVWRSMLGSGGGGNLPTCSDGDTLVASGGSWVCGFSNINPFDFADQTGANISALIESDIVQITGLVTTAPTSVSGAGSPQYRTCSDASCASEIQTWISTMATIENNQYVQLRLTSSSSPLTELIATMTVGVGNADWSVTTKNSTTCTVVATNSVYTGLSDDLGNMSAAACQAACENGAYLHCTRLTITGRCEGFSVSPPGGICSGSACGCPGGGCYDRRWDCI